jgi:hypothetical protein
MTLLHTYFTNEKPEFYWIKKYFLGSFIFFSHLDSWGCTNGEKTAPVARPKLQNASIAFEQCCLIALSYQQKIVAMDLIEQ